MRVKRYGMAALVPALALTMAGCRQPETRPAGPVMVKVMKAKPTAVAGGQVYSGTVEESAGTTLSFPMAGTVRQIRVEAGQRVAAGELLPGMLCTLGLETGNQVQLAIMLPARIVQTDENNRPFVWVNYKGKAQKRVIVTGRSESLGVEVASGLSVGEEVIVERLQKVSESTAITTIYNRG